MDLVSLSILSFFGAALAGGLLGFVVGRFSRFELGLAVGLLVIGTVAMTFAVRCFLEYRDFTSAGANAAWGEVIAIEDRPENASSSITTPVPVVRFTAPDNATHVLRGPSAGGAKVGEHVNVIYDPADPQRSRIAKASELRGAAIAMLLFGTFPLTLGVWLLLFSANWTDEPRAVRRAGRRVARRAATAPAAEAGPVPASSRGHVLAALNGGMFCAILWIGLGPGELLLNFVQGFAAIAVICAGYAVWGAAGGRTGAAWNGGMVLLAVNFGVWAFALQLLR